MWEMSCYDVMLLRDVISHITYVRDVMFLDYVSIKGISKGEKYGWKIFFPSLSYNIDIIKWEVLLL